MEEAVPFFMVKKP